MTDVFIRRSETKRPLRDEMYDLVQKRWCLEKCNVLLAWDQVGWDNHHGTVRDTRLWIENQALSDPYIVTDDDVLIVGKDWVKRAVDALLGSPEYGAVSSLSLIETENLAVAPADTPKGSIYPMHAVGAPMVIRKGLIGGIGEMDLNSECGVIHAHLLSKGLKEGLVNGLRHNHMGHGFSSNPALFWGY